MLKCFLNDRRTIKWRVQSIEDYSITSRKFALEKNSDIEETSSCELSEGSKETIERRKNSKESKYLILT